MARAARDYLPRDQVASPSGSLQEILAHPDIIPTHHHPLLGRQAPDFELADPEGKVWNLEELLDGRPVVLIFYYGYHCVHCVRQLFEVNRDLPLFREVGARVVAISADPPELTRRRFQQYGPFGFPVLSDPGNKVAQAYQVFKGRRTGTTTAFLRHGTFVIDRDGTVQWVNVGDAPFRRNPALLYQLAKMEDAVGDRAGCSLSPDLGGTGREEGRFCVTAALVLACASCGNKDSIYPVSGKVTYKGSPASGAVVFFHRQGGDATKEPPIMGIVQEDGSFELVCGSLGKGAPPGDYDVLIEWKRVAGKGKRRPQTGPDKLKGRYADRKHPLLHATVEA